MWVFTTGGFTSAVEHRDDPSMTMVRARDKKSLEEMLSSMKGALVEGGKSEEEITEFMKDMNIYAVPGDYKWRCVLPKSAYALYLVYEAMHYVNYSNFKSKLTATRGDKWHDAAMSVWSAMFKIQDTQKTGNPDVDNPKPYSSYYHDYDWAPSGYNYPAKKESGESNSSGKANQTEGTAEGSEHGLFEDYYAADYKGEKYGHDWSGSAQQRYWGDDIGLNPMFEEDLEGYEDGVVPSGTNGYHTFNGGPLNRADVDRIDGRADIIDGEFVGSTFLDSELDGPTDAELLDTEQRIAESWEPWDEETEFNTMTGETRSMIDGSFDGRLSGRKSVMAMSDAEFMAYENEM